MSEDALLARIEEVQRVAREAICALEAADRTLELARQDSLVGAPAVAVVEGMFHRDGTAVRARASESVTNYSSAAMALRGEIVRVLVDEAGVSFASVAAEMRVSRSMVTRLYQAAKRGQDQDEG